MSVVDMPETFHECLFLLLKSSNQGLVNKFLLGNIYCSPSSSLINDKNLYDLLHHTEQNFSVPKLIVGDFNFSMIKSAQRRRKHCALAVVRQSQKFSPRYRPPSRGTGWPKFNQLEMVTTFTYKPSLVRIDARNVELSL